MDELDIFDDFAARDDGRSSVRRGASADEAVLATGSGATEERCHLCQEMVHGAAAEQLRGFELHKECLLAVRCHRRLVGKGGPAIVSAADRIMRDDPGAWRAEVLPLLRRGSDGKRDATARARIACAIEESVNETSRIQDQLLLTKPRYKTFMKQWDAVESEAASSDFERVGEEQGWAHTRRGVKYVAVDDNPRLRKKESAVKRQRTDDDDHRRAAAGAPSDAERRGRADRGSARDARRRPRSQSSVSDGASTVRGAATATGSVAGSSRGRGTVTPRRRERSPRRSHPPETPRSADSRAAGASDGADASPRRQTPGKMTTIGFMHQRSSMAAKLHVVLAGQTGSKGTATKIETTLAKMSKEQAGSEERHRGGRWGAGRSCGIQINNKNTRQPQKNKSQNGQPTD